MPCAGLQGVEYIDAIVAEHYGGLHSTLLREFVENDANIWCPTWVRRNYQVRNQFIPAATAANTAAAEPARDAKVDNPEKSLNLHEYVNLASPTTKTTKPKRKHL